MKKKNTYRTWTPPIVENQPEGTEPNFDDHMERRLQLQGRMMGGLLGAVVGDALGVPVEFKSRDEVKRNPVTGMRGGGTFNLPAGSWSDDSSLLICTVDSLVHGYNTADMADRFIRWKTEGFWTPYGKAFDIGNSTADAIRKLRGGVSPEKSGGSTENDNGNGSLMRILPAAMYFMEHDTGEFISRVHAISSITHRHPRSLMACGIYCLIARALLGGKEPAAACKEAAEIAHELYDSGPYRQEIKYFKRVLEGTLSSLKEDEVSSSGYVVHTLEASLWCLLTTGSFEQAVLKAVNLGEDTDTTGCVTGGLAGIYYGRTSIPGKWLQALARGAEIDTLFDTFAAGIEMKD